MAYYCTMYAATSPTSKPSEQPAIDMEGLQRHVSSLVEQGLLHDTVVYLLNAIRQLLELNAHQEIQLTRLLKELYGRRSERLDPRQLILFMAASTALPVAVSQTTAPDIIPERGETQEPDKSLEEAVAAEKLARNGGQKRPKRTGRNPLPQDLPREVEEIPLSAEELACPVCGRPRTQCGFEVSEVLELMPARFVVKEYRRVKAVCRPCEGQLVTAPVAEKPVEKGLPGFGLLADVLVSKYRDAQPLHHLSGRYARLGVTVSASTLGEWVRRGCGLLEALYKRLCALVIGATVLGADDTVLKVLDRRDRRKIKRGHLWAYVGYEGGRAQYVAFDYAPDWKGKHPRRFLKDRAGPVQGDGYAGLEPLFSGVGARCVKVGCFMHIRRKFFAALESGDTRAAAPMKLLTWLYQVEELGRLRGVDAAGRLALREAYTVRLMGRLRRWLEENQGVVEPKALLGKAITYAVNQWSSVQLMLVRGDVWLDNGEVERQIRAVAKGRKAYLFAGSDEGGRRAAVAYTLMANCVLAGVNPQAWLEDVLRKVAGGWPAKRLDELLPRAWKAAREGEKAAQASTGEVSTKTA